MIVDYNDDGSPRRDAEGRLTKVGKGGTGLLLAQISDRVPPDGYTDAKETEKKVIRDAFKDGDAYFNSGDLVHDQAFARLVRRPVGRHLPLEGRERGHHRGRGAVDAVDAVEQTVATVSRSRHRRQSSTAWSRGQAPRRTDLDPVKLAAHLYDAASYAIPLFVRIVDELESTSTFKTRKVELRNEGYSETGADPLYALAGRAKGYVLFYDEYAADVAAAKVRRGSPPGPVQGGH